MVPQLVTPTAGKTLTLRTLSALLTPLTLRASSHSPAQCYSSTALRTISTSSTRHIKHNPYPGLRRFSTSRQFCSESSTEDKMASSLKSLETLEFVNSAVKSLPVDDIDENYVRSVPGACFSRIKPTSLKNPKLVAYSQGALALLDLPPSEISRSEFIEYFCGNQILPGSEPAAHCYCGHQFGNFAGQLGDGCALLLGEIKTSKGDRWELQLKGSGKTPYSRTADGRKVLRSSIREFLCSEAMHHLGIPTTRAGTCITSDDTVIRDLLYNGNAILEKATVISRIAPTFIRFGSFEIFKTRDAMTGRVGPSVGRTDILEQLLDYTTSNFFPLIHSAHCDDRKQRTAAFFQEVCQRTARLVALWQSVGFCHGVLNTDNMSIVGITIDYGPFGFMDRYDPGHICNGSDDGGRYAYSRQPSVCRWNLGKLAEALHLFLDDDEVDKGLDMFDAEFKQAYLAKMRLKLGLIKSEQPNDSDLIESLLDAMEKSGCDYTNCFQALSRVTTSGSDEQSFLAKAIQGLLDQCSTPQETVKSYRPSMHPRQLQMFHALMQNSPEVLAALGVSPEAITAEIDRQQSIEKIKNVSVEEKRERDRGIWLPWLKRYRLRLIQEVEGLDSEKETEIHKERLEAMEQNNPKFILRNHIAQQAIQMAENGDYSEVRKILELLKSPYDSALAPTNSTNTCATNADDISGTREATIEEAIQPMNDGMSQYFSKPPLLSLGTVVT